uniref:Uncharacterized protein n=1 Tax=Knipowitschia caucasica TaxID=637954 RepID=A0AAV2MSR4_KNICA
MTPLVMKIEKSRPAKPPHQTLGSEKASPFPELTTQEPPVYLNTRMPVDRVGNGQTSLGFAEELSVGEYVCDVDSRETQESIHTVGPAAFNYAENPSHSGPPCTDAAALIWGSQGKTKAACVNGFKGAQSTPGPSMNASHAMPHQCTVSGQHRRLGMCSLCAAVI